MPSKLPFDLSHIVLQVDRAVVHVYSVAPLPRSLLTEAKQSLTSVYFYDKHKPHTTAGQYHLHVYLKNNQIFAINWNGTAHDQSHQKVIPGKVFRALKAKFPNLVLPSSRIIESISIDPTAFTPKPGVQFGSGELLSLRELIVEEVQLAGNAAFPPFSQFAIYDGDHVPFVGWPLLVIAAEYRDSGEAYAESHMVWIQGKGLGHNFRSFSMKPTAADHAFGSRLEFVCHEALEIAKTDVQLRIDRQWAKHPGAWAYPNFSFHARPIQSLIRLWYFGTATREIQKMHDSSELMTLKVNIAPILKLPSVGPPIE